MYNVCASLLNFTWIMVDWPWILFPAVLHASSANLPESPDYNTVLKMLKDVSETTTFCINSLCLLFTFHVL